MFINLIKKNRSYRGYDESRQITRDELLEMIDCARLAPSTANGQPLKFYLAWEPETVAKIQGMTKWAGALPDMVLPHQGKCPTGFIVICQDTNLGDSLSRYQKDVGIAAQTILLAATEMGLGGCMIGSFGAKAVKDTLELSDHLEPMLIVAIGLPDEEVVVTEVGTDGSIKYYRDENDVHYVPKRSLEDIII